MRDVPELQPNPSESRKQGRAVYLDCALPTPAPLFTVVSFYSNIYNRLVHIHRILPYLIDFLYLIPCLPRSHPMLHIVSLHTGKPSISIPSLH